MGHREGVLHRVSARVFAALVVLAWCALTPRAARAHTQGMSRSELVVDGSIVHAHLAFARAEVSALLRGGSDADLRDIVQNGIAVTADEDVCPGELAHAGAIEADGYEIDARFTCPHAPGEISVTLYFLNELPRGHRHIVSLEAGSLASQAILDAEHRAVSLAIDPAKMGSAGKIGGSTFLLGIEHILSGWDHLLFLGALLLTARGLRSVVILVTSFTVAHSLTLALAALRIVAIPERVVEPVIYASIAVAAWSNLQHRKAPRAVIAFAFGLVHGFGFAAALADLGLGPGRLAPALFGFNAGVEVGQLGVVTLTVPFLAWLRRRGALDERRTRAVSWVLGAVALALCVARVAFRLET